MGSKIAHLLKSQRYCKTKRYDPISRLLRSCKGKAVVPILLMNECPRTTWDFCYEGPCDLDLWPTALTIDRGLLLLGTNLHIKFQDNRLKRSLVIGQTSFLFWRSLWPWPLTYWPQNQNRSSITRYQPPHQVSRQYAQAFLGYWSNKLFVMNVPVTLTFDLLTPTSIRVFYYSVPTSTSSFKTISLP